MDDTTPVAIIGAGPAGLAIAACLRQAGQDFVLLEKEEQAAPAWRRHYERVHLHTTKRYSSLPFVPFPREYPRYVPRDLFASYLDAYAQRFDLRPRFGETVRAISRRGRSWLVDTTTGPPARFKRGDRVGQQRGAADARICRRRCLQGQKAA
ncbi:FAD-dependent oxidoreductase [Mesorhizobium sp. M0618]|uniref:FAD-dependent oxidoreductase n=1 Tax=unclassified Mesorhizobium TaxID=325217 RepID=UPI00333BC47C